MTTIKSILIIFSTSFFLSSIPFSTASAETEQVEDIPSTQKQDFVLPHVMEDIIMTGIKDAFNGGFKTPDPDVMAEQLKDAMTNKLKDALSQNNADKFINEMPLGVDEPGKLSIHH